jgi:hypothetical protein
VVLPAAAAGSVQAEGLELRAVASVGDLVRMLAKDP